jgi:hypothetical protein
VTRVLAVLLAVAVVSFSIWAWFAGPCSLYSFSAVKNVPARCLMR